MKRYLKLIVSVMLAVAFIMTCSVNVSAEEAVFGKEAVFNVDPYDITVGYTLYVAFDTPDYWDSACVSRDSSVATAKFIDEQHTSLALSGVSVGKTQILIRHTGKTEADDFTYIINVNVKEMSKQSDTDSGNTNKETKKESKETKQTTDDSSRTDDHDMYNNKISGTWQSDAVGWWFKYNTGQYPTWEWLYIDNKWYFFDRSGYMCHNEYRFGCWITPDGYWDYKYSDGTWKSDSTGWWYEDDGWYPTNTWLKIDGEWYYFKSNGYIASNEYIDGYWIGEDGIWK